MSVLKSCALAQLQFTSFSQKWPPCRPHTDLFLRRDVTYRTSISVSQLMQASQKAISDTVLVKSSYFGPSDPVYTCTSIVHVTNTRFCCLCIITIYRPCSDTTIFVKNVTSLVDCICFSPHFHKLSRTD